MNIKVKIKNSKNVNDIELQTNGNSHSINIFQSDTVTEIQNTLRQGINVTFSEIEIEEADKAF